MAAELGGQPVVLKAAGEGSPGAAHVPQVLRALRALGAPVPRELHRVVVGRVTWVVQELLPGAPPPTLAAPALAALQLARGAQHGLGADLGLSREGPTWTGHVHACLDPGGPWADRWRALAGSSPEGAGFVRTALARLRAAPLPALPEDDVVHGDLHHGNLLVDGERLTGVVDWDDAGPGDARADLVTLLLSARATAPDPALAAVLLPLVRAELEPDLRWRYATRDVVRFVGWFALHHPGWDVPGWLRALTPAIADLEAP